MEVEELCMSLLTIVIKSAGATKGILFLERGEQLYVESGIIVLKSGNSIQTIENRKKSRTFFY
jgi:hypothetical protein